MTHVKLTLNYPYTKVKLASVHFTINNVITIINIFINVTLT